MRGISILNGRYAVTMDMYPLQSKEFNRVYKFYDHLREGRFTTTKCKDCGVRSFPPRVICPECLSENLEWVDLPTEGTVKVVTEEVVGVPLGFETPLIHALIDLEGELNHFARVINCQAGELQEGDRVKLAVFPVDPVPVDGKRGAVIEMERVFYAFEKIK
jgi:uncharacterized OB-fold protein